ncbi:ABC transporter ATP-binding protein [Bacteriovorax sp. Seq25_V]|uniref:ABC transporter ATP-binding protein n=1 Tax=Bacteriovorax sp. Seq25_V TaxID=1201288 RepID=UPI00038A26FB|nr:ABC transporter ATP-binding protein [Bacteriovorax sp. Seq25_V]EQC45681.1 oligopeptide ABC transporter, ATP-binding protein OppD [Bacteriovorax sp. Seq25_V]
MNILLKVRNLSIKFQTKKGIIEAVRDVNFNVHEGETLGVVGESGCGKSITNMAIMGLLAENAIITADELIFNGKNLLTISTEEWQQIRGKEIGMIFQDPMSSLNPCYTVEQQLTEVLDIHEPNLTREEKAQRVLDLLYNVGIPAPKDRLKAYPHELSGGMSQRIMIAMAIACNPKLLIADEPTTALDVTVQQQIIDLIESLKVKFNMSVIFVSHDLSVVKDITDRIQVMYAGEIIETGKTDLVINQPKHPYTKGLLDSIPSFHTTKTEELFSISGIVPDLHHRPQGCQFYARCFNKKDDCNVSTPKISEVENREVRCIHTL